MRIFVTGGSGFLGSYLVADLLRGGHEVAALVRSYVASSWRLQALSGRVVAIRGTFDDIPAWCAALSDFRPQAVAHLAWRGVGGSERNSPNQARNIADAADITALAADVGA